MVDIKDAPKYDWRGFHIDVVRHMFTVDYLKKVIDCLSFYKINKLHLHLTDDQGWRIEVKKYPLLTQEGSWRDFDEYDKRCVELSQQDYNYEIDPRFVRNGSQYGGHYTQEEMKGLVSYALERGIDIVPEIDMPGHFSAAIKVYPELSCTGEAGWGERNSLILSVPRARRTISSCSPSLMRWSRFSLRNISISEQMKWRKITGNSVKFVSD